MNETPRRDPVTPEQREAFRRTARPVTHEYKFTIEVIVTARHMAEARIKLDRQVPVSYKITAIDGVDEP